MERWTPFVDAKCESWVKIKYKLILDYNKQAFWGMRPSLYGGTDCSEFHRIYYYGSWCSESQAEMAVSLYSVF